MPGSNYLANVSSADYGLPTSLPAGFASQASGIIDSYLNRPEGVIYTTDANGFPCYMVNATPSMTYTLTGAILPGKLVSATVSPTIIIPDFIGQVWIIDRLTNPANVEAVVVQATTGNNGVTFHNVQFSHAADASIEAGMVISEDRNMPNRRSIARFSRLPMVNVLSLLGRYAYGRRSDQVGGLYQDMNLLATIQTFGGPPEWIPVPIHQVSWSNSTAEIWVPAGQLLAYYSDARINYIAGWTTPPDPIIRATASVAAAILTDGQGLGSGNIKMIGAGSARLTKFTPSMISRDISALIDPFKAREFF
jgi:hypothetical protein